jgi:hypothetical protein
MSIEENTVLLVMDAMIGYVVIVEIAVVIKILMMRKVRINKLTLKLTILITNWKWYNVFDIMYTSQ